MKLCPISKKERVFDVFLPPVPKWYIGKILYGTPYFDPIGFVSTIIGVRKLIPKSHEECTAYKEKYPHLSNREEALYKNMPLTRRSYYKIVKVFGNSYFVRIGSPIKVGKIGLGWKDKYESPRFEFSPAIYLFFFNWQIFVHWHAPVEGKNGYEDNYWEQLLWYSRYSNYDLEVARKTWPWVDSKTKKSTWNENFLRDDYKKNS